MSQLENIMDSLGVFIRHLDNTKKHQRNEDISAFLRAIKNQLEEIKPLIKEDPLVEDDVWEIKNKKGKTVARLSRWRDKQNG